MRVRNTITGIESNERKDIAQALMRQGLCEVVGESPDEAKARLPKYGDANVTLAFSVGHYEGRYAAIFLKVLGMTRRYTGDPRFIHNKRNHDGTPFCGSLGYLVPVEIQKQYLALWASSEHEPSMPGEGAAQRVARETFGPEPSNADIALEKKGRTDDSAAKKAQADHTPELIKVLKEAERIIAAQEWK